MPWYALYTKSRHEDTAEAGLQLKAYRTYLPKIEVWSRRKDRRKKIRTPLFSGYLFLHVQDLTNEAKVDILKTHGVVRILGKPNSPVPSPVPEDQIEAIKRILDAEVEIIPYQYPRLGERTRIIDGPFRGIEGIVKATDYKKNLFVVSIDLLQRSVAIKLEGFQIERA